GIWLNQDALFGPDSPQPVVATPEGTTSQDEPDAEPSSETAAAQPDESERQTPAAAGNSTDSQKFTQRLTPDGSEIDAGPANGGASIGEGTSLATVTQPPAQATSPEPAETPPASEPTVAVGQRAI